MILPTITGILLIGTGALVPSEQGVSVPLGSTATLPITVTDSTGAAVNLAGGSLTLTARNQTDPPSLSVAAVLTAPTLGQAQFYFSAASWALLTQGALTYDVWYVDSIGNRSQVVAPGLFLVTKRVPDYAAPSPTPPPLPVPTPAVPTVTQSDWYVDWTNGNDANPGTIAFPCKTVMGGVVARWGAINAILAQDTTIHIVSSQPASAEVIALAPQCNGHKFNITGATTTLASGVILSGVTAKNRATPQELLVTLGANYPGGTLLQNTTHPSTAVIKSMSGNVATVMQPLNGFARVDTWANGDSVNVIAPVDLNLSVLSPTGVTLVSLPFSGVTGIRVIDPTGVPGTTPTVIEADGIFLFRECGFQSNPLIFGKSPLGPVEFVDCWSDPASSAGFKGYTSVLGGYLPAVWVVGGGINNFTADCHIGVIWGGANFGNVYLESAVASRYYPGQVIQILVAGAGDGPYLWGPGSINNQLGGKVLLVSGTWTANVLIKGPMTLSGLTTGTQEVAGVLTDGITVNQANLDSVGALFNLKSGTLYGGI